MTYIVIYKRALNTNAKMKALNARMDAYIKSGQKQAAGAIQASQEVGG